MTSKKLRMRVIVAPIKAKMKMRQMQSMKEMAWGSLFMDIRYLKFLR